MHYGGDIGSDLEGMPEQTFDEPTKVPTHQPTEEDGEEFLPEPTHRMLANGCVASSSQTSSKW